MATSSHRSSLAPPPNANLYCAQCDSQIGIFENEWIQLTPTYARSKEKGVHFGTEIGARTQTVPSGDAKGCRMSEIFCTKCSSVVGQHCKTAPEGEPEKHEFVGQSFYKITKTYLKDAQTSTRLDRIFKNDRRHVAQKVNGHFRGSLAPPHRVSSLSKLSGTPIRASMPPFSRSQSSQMFTPYQENQLSPAELPRPTSATESADVTQELHWQANLAGQNSARLEDLEKRLESQNRRMRECEDSLNELEQRSNEDDKRIEYLESAQSLNAEQMDLQDASVDLEKRDLALLRKEFKEMHTRFYILENLLTELQASLLAISTGSSLDIVSGSNGSAFINVFENMLRTMKNAQSSDEEVQKLREENATLKSQLGRSASEQGTSQEKVNKLTHIDGNDLHVLGKRKRQLESVVVRSSQTQQHALQQPNINGKPHHTQQFPTPGSSQAGEMSPAAMSQMGQPQLQSSLVQNESASQSSSRTFSSNENNQIIPTKNVAEEMVDIVMDDDAAVDTGNHTSDKVMADLESNDASFEHGREQVLHHPESPHTSQRTSSAKQVKDTSTLTAPGPVVGSAENELRFQRGTTGNEDMSVTNKDTMPPFFGATLLPPSNSGQEPHQEGNWPAFAETVQSASQVNADLSLPNNSSVTLDGEGGKTWSTNEEVGPSPSGSHNQQPGEWGRTGIVEFSDEEIPDSTSLSVSRMETPVFAHPATRSHDPTRRLTDPGVNREDRSMAPEPPKRQRMTELKRQSLGINMNRAIISTPEMYDGVKSRNPRSVRPPSVQSRERDLNDELVRLGLDDWIGKDKNSKAYKNAVDKARTQQRIMNKASQMMKRGLPGEIPPEIAEAIRNLNATKAQPIDVNPQYSEPYLHGVMKLTDPNAAGRKRGRPRKDRTSEGQSKTNLTWTAPVSSAVPTFVEPARDTLQDQAPEAQLQQHQPIIETVNAEDTATSAPMDTQVEKENHIQPHSQKDASVSKRRYSKRSRPSGASDTTAAAAEENDDNCAECGKRGNLLCCDGCPKAYHHKCLTPPMNPKQQIEGDWFCPTCQEGHPDSAKQNTVEQSSSNVVVPEADNMATAQAEREQQIRDRDRLVQEAMEREETIIAARY